MSAKKTSVPKKKENTEATKKRDKISLPEIREYVASAYIFMMLTVFPLYVRKGFIMLASYKVVYYRNVSLLFLAVGIALFVPMIISGEFAKNIKARKYSWLDIAVLAYGIWNVISFLLSPYKADSIRGYAGWEMGLVAQGLMVFGYFLTRCWYDKGKGSVIAAGITLALESALVVLNRTGNDPLGFYKHMGWFEWDRRNLLGTVGNINWISGYLICVLPILVILYMQADKFYKRLLWGIGLYLSFAAIMLAGSRSAVFTLAVLLIVMMIPASFSLWSITRYLEMLFMICIFWSQMTLFTVDLIEPMRSDTPHTVYSPLWYIPTVILLAAIIAMNLLLNSKMGTGRKDAGKTAASGKEGLNVKLCPSKMWNFNRDNSEFTPPKAVRMLLLVLPLAILGSGALVFILCQFSDSVWQMLGSKDLLRLSDSWGSNRFQVWKETMKAFSKEGIVRWIFGVGPDAFGVWYEKAGITIAGDGEFAGAIYTNAHNEWITALVNTGFIGVLSYLAIFVMAVWKYGKNIKKEPMVLLGLLTTLVYLVNQFVSFQQICMTPLFFIILGICARMCDDREGKRKPG